MAIVTAENVFYEKPAAVSASKPATGGRRTTDAGTPRETIASAASSLGGALADCNREHPPPLRGGLALPGGLIAGILLGVLKPAIAETDVHLSQLPQSLPEMRLERTLEKQRVECQHKGSETCQACNVTKHRGYACAS